MPCQKLWYAYAGWHDAVSPELVTYRANQVSADRGADTVAEKQAARPDKVGLTALPTTLD